MILVKTFEKRDLLERDPRFAMGGKPRVNPGTIWCGLIFIMWNPIQIRVNSVFSKQSQKVHGCLNRSGRSGPVSICALDRNGQSGPGRCPGRSPDATGSGLSGPVLILQKHYPCPVRPGAIFQNRCPVQSGPERCPAVYWFSPVRCPVRPVDDSAYHRIRCTVRFSVDLAILQRCPNSLCPNWY